MYNIERRKTRTCVIGVDPSRRVLVGSDHPVAIQTMAISKTHETENVLREIESIKDLGCDFIRLTVPDIESAKAIPFIKKHTDMPIVADIHFDPRMALAALDYGADKIRINPGNFFDKTYLEQVTSLAKSKNAAMRIGVNAGSLEKDLWKKYDGPTPEALAESAIRWSEMIEAMGFGNFVVSIKSERVPVMVQAYRKFAEHKNDIPLHLGVTHAGLLTAGTVKNSIGIGILLSEGIGDTIRASITDSIQKEVEVCKNILKSLGMYSKEPDVIACPTCGRIEIDLEKMTKEVELALKHIKKPIRVAVMGCVVNSVGEAKESDFAIAGGKHAGAIYFKGELYKANIKEKDLVKELIKLIEEQTN